MSSTQIPPAGWSIARFESVASDAGSWLWGTVQGTFNEKASLSQIIVDAVVGMIPLVGDATAVRDLIAVTIGLVDQPAKRNDKWQWVMLVVLVFALIPVLGGVIKGVGRIAVKVAEEAAHLTGIARAARMEQAAKDIVAFLNRVGRGNAEKWLLKLNVLDYQAQIIERFERFAYTINGALVQIEKRLGRFLSEGVRQRIEGLKTGLNQVVELGRKMIPEAIKELNQTLKEIQSYVRSGGETTSRVTAHTVVAGDRAALSYTEELRLLEGVGAKRSARGGWIKNSSQLKDIQTSGVYKYEPGYPNLLAEPVVDAATGTAFYSEIATYSGKIVNRELEKGEQVFRVFGPGGVTHDAEVGMSSAAGNPKRPFAFWGVGPQPKSAQEWREVSGAVLDEWNRDGFIIVGTVEESGTIKACTGKIAEQTGNKIPGQYLPGGGKQAILGQFPSASEINAVAGEVVKDGKPRSFTADGVRWEIKPSGWTDANGIHGYDLVTGKAAVQTVRLGAREQASKQNHH